MTWHIEQTAGGKLGNKYSIKSGDLWLGHLYLDDISENVDIDQVLNLIGAAPDLLDALEEITNAYKVTVERDMRVARMDCPDWMPNWTPEKNNIYINKAKKAIAKARGE